MKSIYDCPPLPASLMPPPVNCHHPDGGDRHYPRTACPTPVHPAPMNIELSPIPAIFVITTIESVDEITGHPNDDSRVEINQ
jgi:hypothetical protein